MLAHSPRDRGSVNTAGWQGTGAGQHGASRGDEHGFGNANPSPEVGSTKLLLFFITSLLTVPRHCTVLFVVAAARIYHLTTRFCRQDGSGGPHEPEPFLLFAIDTPWLV